MTKEKLQKGVQKEVKEKKLGELLIHKKQLDGDPLVIEIPKDQIPPTPKEDRSKGKK